MKVLLVTPLYPPEIGGPATYAALLERALPEQGIAVEVVKFSNVRHLPKLIRHLALYRRVCALAQDADIIFALDPVSVGVPTALAAWRTQKPFLVKVVGDYAWEQGRQRFGLSSSLDDFVQSNTKPFMVRFFVALQRWVVMRAAAIIVPSHYLRRIVIAWGVPDSRIRVIRNAVHLGTIGNVAPEVEALSRPLVVTAGRLVPWKRIDSVIDAIAEAKLSLAIIGDGPLRAELEARAQDRAPGQVVFTGTLSHADTLATIHAADVFVLNSSYEGLSHLLMEAVALRVPVITTDAGGNREVITDPAYGVLIPHNSARALQEALEQCVWSKPPVAGVDFSEEKMVTELVHLFHTL